HMKASDPIHKATIIPRGRALGMVMRLPEKDSYSMRRDQCLAHLAVAMGGRVAEEMIFGHDAVTTGASGDIKMATEMSRRMVTEWGLSDKLGPLLYSANQEEVFLGHSVAQQKNMSDATAQLIDNEVRRFVEEGETTARKILTEHVDQLHTIAKGLLDYETLSGDDIKILMEGGDLNRPDEDDDPIDSGPSSAVPEADGHKSSGGTGGLEPEPQPGS
ncbi:MAG: cell division protein FtsH, partial [Sneathiella sp.]|nr:cell division protein FtsH [Sneathiella sp.]